MIWHGNHRWTSKYLSHRQSRWEQPNNKRHENSSPVWMAYINTKWPHRIQVCQSARWPTTTCELSFKRPPFFYIPLLLPSFPLLFIKCTFESAFERVDMEQEWVRGRESLSKGVRQYVCKCSLRAAHQQSRAPACLPRGGRMRIYHPISPHHKW